MKNQRLNLRITAEDLSKIKQKSKQADMTLTDYVTKVSLGKQITRIDGLDEMIKQLKAIGKNLNRLNTVAEMGRISVIYLDETKAELREINRKIQELLERKRWQNGNS